MRGDGNPWLSLADNPGGVYSSPWTPSRPGADPATTTWDFFDPQPMRAGTTVAARYEFRIKASPLGSTFGVLPSRLLLPTANPADRSEVRLCSINYAIKGDRHKCFCKESAVDVGSPLGLSPSLVPVWTAAHDYDPATCKPPNRRPQKSRPKFRPASAAGAASSSAGPSPYPPLPSALAALALTPPAAPAPLPSVRA